MATIKEIADMLGVSTARKKGPTKMYSHRIYMCGLPHR